MGGAGGSSGGKVRMTVKEARPILEAQELETALEGQDLAKAANAAVEESGIVFIDEIDKVRAVVMVLVRDRVV